MAEAAYRIVFLRHGESVDNQKGIFSGWRDVDLSEQGVHEARNAGKLLRMHGFTFDVAYTSLLKRANRTLALALEEMHMQVPAQIPIIRTWRLNERHYGSLQGKSKEEVLQEVGAEQFNHLRRGYDTPPPPLATDDPTHPSHDPAYANVPKEELPSTESLALCRKRVMPCWENEIVPAIKAGKHILVSAHGNSLRSIIMHLEQLSKEEVANLNLATGFPLVYELDEDLNVIRKQYLGDPQKIKQNIDGKRVGGK